MTDAERIEQLEIRLEEMEDFACTFLAVALISGSQVEGGLSSSEVRALIDDFVRTRAKNGQADGSRLAERLRGIMER